MLGSIITDRNVRILADRALAEFDLSPDDRKIATQLLISDLAVSPSIELREGEIARVLRTIDCEFVARRHSLIHAAVAQ